MSTSSDAEARSFAETRRTLLDALDRTEQEAHDQATELVRLAERRAREITVKADQSAALLEEQLTYLTAQLDHVRARVTDIRTRLAHELQGDRTATAPVLRSVIPPRSEIPSRPVGSAAPIMPAPQDTAQPEIGVSDNDSLPETLRVLRAALESLNGQPTNDRQA